MQVSSRGLWWFTCLSSSSSCMGYSADQAARSGTQGHSVPKPGYWWGWTVRPLALVGFKLPALKCKWQVLAPLCLSEPPPGSFMRLQALSSQLWPRFPPSQQGSKDGRRGENKERRRMRGRGPLGRVTWPAHPPAASL